MNNYIEQALRTESPATPELLARLDGAVRATHAIFGLTTEIGELTDIFKRHIFYGREMDYTNMDEEIGDLLWYMAILMDFCGVDFEQCMQRNIAKLRSRYPDKFTEEDALNRDLEEERAVLEGKQLTSPQDCLACGSGATRPSAMNPGKMTCNVCGAIT